MQVFNMEIIENRYSVVDAGMGTGSGSRSGGSGEGDGSGGDGGGGEGGGDGDDGARCQPVDRRQGRLTPATADGAAG